MKVSLYVALYLFTTKLWLRDWACSSSHLAELHQMTANSSQQQETASASIERVSRNNEEIFYDKRQRSGSHIVILLFVSRP